MLLDRARQPDAKPIVNLSHRRINTYAATDGLEYLPRDNTQKIHGSDR
jgi:hypothetical protein